MSGPTPATLALARVALRRAELEALEAQMAEGMTPNASAMGASGNAMISLHSSSPPTQLALDAGQAITDADGGRTRDAGEVTANPAGEETKDSRTPEQRPSTRDAGEVAANPAGESTEASRTSEQSPAEGCLDWDWILGERQMIDGRDVGPAGPHRGQSAEAGTMLREEGRDADANVRSDETDEAGAAERAAPSGNGSTTANEPAEGCERAENTAAVIARPVTDADEEVALTADIMPGAAPVPPGSATVPMDVDNDTLATPAQENATEVIEIEDEGGEVEAESSRGMTARDFSSRVYRLGSLASSLAGEWQTFTTLWTSVGAFEGAHDWRNGPSRLPTGNARSVSKWQSKRRLAATLDDEHPESHYVARVAQMYHEVRGMPFEAVARMYGRYGLIGIAYGLTQAYALQPSEGLEVIALDFVDLLAAIRDVRLGRTVSFDTSSTVEEVLASLDPESAAAAVAALVRFMRRLRQQPPVATPPPPPSKSPRKRDRDDKGGAGSANSTGSSSKRAKVKSSSPGKRCSTKP